MGAVVDYEIISTVTSDADDLGEKVYVQSIKS